MGFWSKILWHELPLVTTVGFQESLYSSNVFVGTEIGHEVVDWVGKIILVLKDTFEVQVPWVSPFNWSVLGRNLMSSNTAQKNNGIHIHFIAIIRI